MNEADDPKAIAYEQAASIVAAAHRDSSARLDLSIENLAQLPKLTGLQHLTQIDLSGSKITYLEPLAEVPTLLELKLNNTPVSDLAPLQQLAGLRKLQLRRTNVSRLAPLYGLSALEHLDLYGTDVSDLTPLQHLKEMKFLNLSNTNVSDLIPIADLKNLATSARMFPQQPDAGLLFSNTRITDRVLLDLADAENPRRTIETLRYLNEIRTLSGLNQELGTENGRQKVRSRIDAIAKTREPVHRRLGLIAKAIAAAVGVDRASIYRRTGENSLQFIADNIVGGKGRSGVLIRDDSSLLWRTVDGGTAVYYAYDPTTRYNHPEIADRAYLSFLAVPIRNNEKICGAVVAQSREAAAITSALADQLETISQPVRTLLVELDTNESNSDGDQNEYSGMPTAIEGVPSPFDFVLTERGTIAVSGSDTNIPAFPLAISREDHARRLEACRVFAANLIQALSQRRYDNVRPEFLSYLQRYLEWLPHSAEDGNILLADGMARSLSKLFAADAEMLPNAFAAELHTLLEQHVATCVYYPEVGTFNRDVRDGKPSRPFPIKAAEAYVQTVQAYTPRTFDPPVPLALSEAQASSPLPPVAPEDMPPPSPRTIQPPSIPPGEIDPRKSREFAAASTANRLWKTVKVVAVASTAGRGVVDAAHALAPHAKELIDWLASVMSSLS
jgi:hypothetical protein